MADNNVKIFIAVIVLMLLGITVTVIIRSNATPAGPGKYDDFTMCLKDKGAVFYGAFWCPHCQAQKKLFGSSAKLLPYVECSTLDGQSQLPVCQAKNIEGYPTWDLADGTRLKNENDAGITLETLSSKTGCVLPVEPVPEVK